MKKGLDRHHVSELDKFLKEFDKQNPEKSASQQAEIAKHQKIAAARDVAKPQDPSQLWEEF